MTPHEAMQMALDWFHWFQHGTNPNGAHVLQVEEALRTALAETDVPETAFGETEPVAWMHNFIDDVIIKNRPTDITCNAGRWTALYTAPPQREWVGLSNEEKKAICQEAANEDWTDLDVINATEAKLREKNG